MDLPTLFLVSQDKYKTMEKVEIIEVWMPVRKGGDAYDYKNKRNLKKIALLVNGQPIYLEKDFALEKRWITKEEADNKFLAHSLTEGVWITL